MRPGEDCLQCHTESGEASNKVWAAAGTVFSQLTAAPDQGLQGVKVILTDAHGRVVQLVSNGAGNFYTAESLAFPLKAAVERNGVQVPMQAAVTNGGCNACHFPGSGTSDGCIAAP
jgi:hypothetical protein